MYLQVIHIGKKIDPLCLFLPHRINPRMKTGLFFGSFNPIHNGHIALAAQMIQRTDLEEFWFVVTPQNPLKNKTDLLEDAQRLRLVRLAVEDIPDMRVSDVEFHMPRPSYTIDTLKHLSGQYPDREFILVMGSDGLENFSLWKNHEEIVKKYSRYIYPRPGTPPGFLNNVRNVKIIEAPPLNISSTKIRTALALNQDVGHLLPPKVYQAILQEGWYK